MDKKTPWESLPNWQQKEIEQSIIDADAGKGISLEAFKKEMDKL